jgi:bZIP transcription factor
MPIQTSTGSIMLVAHHSASHGRKSPTLEMTLSSVDQLDPVYSPTPGASVTSHSSPGSNSYTCHGMPESQSMSSFFGQVSSCPSSSSLEATSNLDPSFSSPPTHIEGSSRLLMPVNSNTSANTPYRAALGSDTKLVSIKEGGKPAVARRRASSVKARKNGDNSGDDTLTHRRLKRLQRNRESARLSRRRRKVYLEVLEERVDKLSDELDKSRREHVANAVPFICKKRLEIISQTGKLSSLYVTSILDNILSRTSDEMMVSNTFLTEQSKSFFLPPSIKCILWLTLQSDSYFRGGRAASERLSAARIGERVSLHQLGLSHA